MALLKNIDFWKLVVSLMTPIIVIIIGYVINRSIQKRTSVTERKVKLFDETAPKLNSLYCYFLFIGNWKELTPPDILKIKRELDQTMHINRFLFLKEFFDLYKRFMDACFKTFTGVGEDAKIRTPLESADGDRRQVYPGEWQSDWDRMFAEKSWWVDPSEIHKSYHHLMKLFARELGMNP
jgi:hypothetical protein